MRIAFLTQSYPPMVSGAAIVAKQLAQGMAEHGHRILVIAASDRGAPYLTQSGNLSELRLRSIVTPIRVGQRFMLPARRVVQQALHDFKPDLIHTHDPFQLSLTGAAYAHLQNIPVILSIHQLPWFVASYVPDVNGLRDSVEDIFWNYARWFLKKFPVTLVPTQTIANIVAARTGIRPRAISCGLDLCVFTASRLSADRERILRHKLGLPANVPVILHVGRLDTDKRVDRVIRAAAKTMSATDAHLLLVGDGREKPALVKLARALGLAGRVHFPGFITAEHGLPEIYRLASLFVTASEIETQGIVLLEAAASGLPIAAVRATCIPEIVHHGENGFLSEPGDIESLAHAMTIILKDPDLTKKMGQASFLLAQPHNRQNTLDAYEDLYRNSTPVSRPTKETAHPPFRFARRILESWRHR